MWAKQNLSIGGRANYSGIGAPIALGGAGVVGFALDAAGDPEIWTKISADQQKWITDTLVKLNTIIVRTTNTTCATWAPSIDRAAGCFQGWFNGAKLGFTKPNGAPLVLRTDGVFDQETLDALRTVAALNPTDFPTAYPGTTLPGPEKTKLSTGAMVGIAAAGAAVLGGVVYAVTRKGKGRRRRR
jgi:hypothetical protein